MKLFPRVTLFLAGCLGGIGAWSPLAAEPFRIDVVDDETGRGVPLVELRTVNDIRLFTDSQGIVAFDEPGLLGQTVFFHVKSPGYEFPKDGFGFAGKALDTRPGGKARLEIRRRNIARRLYRVTGAGIYRDSLLCGVPVPTREPVLNGHVTGSDSVMNAVYRNRIYWFWGDTNRPGYPLGNFNVPGATAPLPGNGLNPARGIDLDYFVDETGFAKETARMPGDGPTWIEALTVLTDSDGRERLHAAYMKIKPPLETYQRGIVEFDDEAQQFRKVTELPLDAPVLPGGHPLRIAKRSREMDAVDLIYFAKPYPLVRVAARRDDFLRLERYEAYTCLREGSRLDRPEIDRNETGNVHYSWKPHTPALGPAEQAKLLASGALRRHEALLQLRDRDSGRSVQAHSGSVYWNAHRRTFVMIAVEIGGETSHLGEVWYAESPSPVGPWVYAVKIVTHDQYSFYNPKQHPMFDVDEGRTIYFEGTYTNTFSGNPEHTPRYDYNQMLYELAVDDPRLMIPGPIVEPTTGAQFVSSDHSWEYAGFRELSFFAADRSGTDTIPIYRVPGKDGVVRLQSTRREMKEAQATTSIAFHALAPDVKHPPVTTIPLYEYRRMTGERYAYRGEEPPTDDADWRRTSDKPLCRVWKNPYRVPFPSSRSFAP